MLLPRLLSRFHLADRKLSITSLSLAAICGVAAQCVAQSEPKVLVLRDVTVVDTRSGALSTHRSVIIRDGRIDAIVAQTEKPPAGAEVIVASGRYVVPGYSDMHIHVTELARTSVLPLQLLVANGVTMVREETTTPEMKARAQEINENTQRTGAIAPEIIFQGGEEHLPPAVNARVASVNGMPSMDHLGAGMGLVLDCSSQASAIRADFLARGYKPSLPPSRDYIENPRAFDGAMNAPFYQRVLNTYDPDRCKDLVQTFAKNKTWQTVTLIRLRTQDWGNDPRWRDNPALRYVPPDTLADWNKLGDRFATLPAEAVATLQNYYALQLKVTHLMAENNVPILSGSDIGGVWLVPGFSLHDEFHELAAAGLSPLQILQTTTLNAAKFLNREDRDGTVDVGKEANLVVLDDNPVADARSLDKIDSVYLKGKLISKTQLASILAQMPPQKNEIVGRLDPKRRRGKLRRHSYY